MNIKYEKFEGPLFLLLKLIEREEMDITEVSLAKVAEDYVSYVRQAKNINPEEMADFLVVAAKLLLIKSKALLPYLYPEEEEEIDELEKQLKMYKEFLEAAKSIDAILKKNNFMFAREFNRKVVLSQTDFFAPPKNLTITDFKPCFKEILMRLRPSEILEEETLDYKINIEEKILSIQSMLLERIRVSFNQVMQQAKNKTEIIVSFLAVLEMMRQKEVTLKQEGLFSDIFIEKNG